MNDQTSDMMNSLDAAERLTQLHPELEVIGATMGDLISRFWPDVMGRISGPFTFRLIVQPLVAAFFGLRSGLRDAREGRPAFGWHLFTTKLGNRRQLIHDACKDIGKLFVMAMIIDVIYEIYVFRWIYPGQVLIVAMILAAPAYIAVRGLTNRISRTIFTRKQ